MRSVEAVAVCERDCSLNNFVLFKFCLKLVWYFEIHVLKFHKVLELDIKT